jgi:glutathione synthase/RimK-type ligase-like ATP-grasp enzyme
MILILLDSNKKYNVNKTVEILSKTLASANTQSETAFFKDVEFFIKTSHVEAFIGEKTIKNFSTIFFRKVGSYKNEAYVLANLASRNKINFLDKIYEHSNESSKMKQTFTFAVNDVSVPKTYYSPEYSSQKIKRAVEFLGLPVVIKFSKSNKGKGVFMAKSEEEIADIMEDDGREAIMQEFLPNEFDYRILVLGSKAVIAEKRKRTEAEEFRNNVCLGAKEEFLRIEDVSKDIISLAERAALAANIQVAGVDVVSSGEKNYILEANRTPAFTHTEESLEIKQLADFLTQCERKK